MAHIINLVCGSPVSQYNIPINPHKYNICTFATIAFLMWCDKNNEMIKFMSTLVDDIDLSDIFTCIINAGYQMYMQEFNNGQLRDPTTGQITEGIDFNVAYSKNHITFDQQLMNHESPCLEPLIICPDTNIDDVLIYFGDIIIINLCGEMVALCKSSDKKYLYFDSHKSGTYNPPGFAICSSEYANNIIHSVDFPEYWYVVSKTKR